MNSAFALRNMPRSSRSASLESLQKRGQPFWSLPNPVFLGVHHPIRKQTLHSTLSTQTMP